MDIQGNQEQQPLFQPFFAQAEKGYEVLPDLFVLRTMIVNVCFVGERGSDHWVLIDAGVGPAAESILQTAEERFRGIPPKAIILTHGHFDHVGALSELLEHWDVPIFAQEEELPFLTGKEDYPPADPTVGGGLMSLISPLYPNEAINLENRIHALPIDHKVPYMDGWRWVHTPGHTPGHISLFRHEDSALIAGDAFITVKQESALAVITQEKEIHGPPAYFTTVWKAAWHSVRILEALKPAYAITGHGFAIEGEELTKGLENLSCNFKEIAIPNN
ncbi:glyoxylase-like metal-dependent hydrolase (beta-lactamase superfamily II) [Oikeobacillus pervagus]|uniref:Glyoxylase-like metal-dependent hydrolase (Beta-lactamase superfamily II) n=1 Tax=Oikeobacillus pervagus TaxID=1325931 RepID=A0AAJ1SXX2_9BACI|nr:MBL fold metallo-hydrolase [Oikeobacillus pervagus]MDQ0214868.1 glyoxylase-like metal-dependent hydrolase (beta-lactamase superfamily II) [Oikeobacillus pervagus]